LLDTVGIVVGILVTILVLFIALGIVLFVFIKKRQRKKLKLSQIRSSSQTSVQNPSQEHELSTKSLTEVSSTLSIRSNFKYNELFRSLWLFRTCESQY
jgi:large-conductance mechanosensitive channel